MHPIFHITVEHIRKLRDDQARELLARLCRAQLSRSGLDGASVHWGGDQRAADGGVDVLIEHLPAVDIDSPLKRSAGVIQVKAEPFGPAKVKTEMVRDKVLRPSIAELARHRGVYLIASTRDNPTEPNRRKRVAAMEQVLSDHGLSGQIRVDFLGAREIADWVEQFPPLAIWVRQVVGEPLAGWKGYGAWAYREDDVQAEFVLSDKLRVFAPGATEAMTDAQGIDAIRADLHAGKSVRLVGLSGVGKTRLAQALFDPRIKTATPPLSPDRAIYADISDRPDPSPEAMTEILRSTREPAVLIVDNCGQQTHSALVEKKGREADELSLLTIEYDIRDDIPDDTRCYRLEGSSDEALWSVLRSHHPSLSGPDLTTVVAASQGNARLAFALASTSRQTGDLTSLRSDDLFRRLFEQKHGAGDELLRCAKAASLIYSFDGEDTSASSEMALLASFAGVSPEAFRSNMIEIRRRGLLQERGKMRALLPHAVSNRLAAEALEELKAGDLEARLFHGAPARVRASFANRLSYLHASKEAQAMVGRWLAPGGELGNVASLSDQDFHIFQRVASVDPAATLSAIERFVASDNASGLHEFEINKLAQITQSIAYEVAYFDRCVEVLLKLVPIQAGKRRNKQGQEHLVALFQAYGSGTLAPAAQRADHISRLLASGEPAEREIGIALLSEALKVRGFRNPGPFQFGSRTRTQGWRPKDEGEYRNWYETFLDIAEPLALKDDDVGKAMRAALGQAVSGFVHDPLLMQHLERLAPEFIRIDGWLAGLKAVRQLLRQKDLREKLRAPAIAFEQLIAPKGVRAQVLAAIAMRDPFDYARQPDDGIDVYERAAKRGEALGRELASDPALLQELLPRLLQGEIYIQAQSIGRGVASATPDARALVAAIQASMRAATDKGSLNPTFMGGLFRGWHDQDPELVSRLLNDALDDPILGVWLPNLQLSVPLDSAGAARLLASIAARRAPIASYQSLGYGGALRPVAIGDIIPILDALAAERPDGNYAAIDVLSMVVHSANDRTPEEREELAAFCRDFMARTPWPSISDIGERLDHEISQVIAFGAKHSREFEDVHALLVRIVDYREASAHFVPGDPGNYLSSVLERHPERTLDYLLTQDSEDRRHPISDMVLAAWASDDTAQPHPVMEPSALVAWCATDPQARIAFTIRVCPLDESEEGKPSTVARLYALAPDRAAFIEALTERCMRGTSSSEELPNLSAGIRLFETLPVAAGSPEEGLRDQAVDDLQERIDWWSKILGRPGRERDEGFE